VIFHLRSIGAILGLPFCERDRLDAALSPESTSDTEGRRTSSAEVLDAHRLSSGKKGHRI